MLIAESDLWSLLGKVYNFVASFVLGLKGDIGWKGNDMNMI